MGKAEVDATVRANRFIDPAGVVATACMHRGPDGTAVGINWLLVRARPGRLGGGWARGTDDHE
jgi:hypothetical protein